MAVYYINHNQDYYSDLYYNFLTTADNEGPDFKRYRPMLYANGAFKAVRPYVGRVLNISNLDGFKAAGSDAFLTKHNQIFMTKDNAQPIATGAEKITTKFCFSRINPYIIQGMIINEIPDGALTDDYNKYLQDDYSKYLISEL